MPTPKPQKPTNRKTNLFVEEVTVKSQAVEPVIRIGIVQRLENLQFAQPGLVPASVCYWISLLFLHIQLLNNAGLL